MATIHKEIDPSLPPYYTPQITQQQPGTYRSGSHQSGEVLEPYSELGDYLDKEDFTNLLQVLGQFAGKTGSGLLSFGESIIDRFSFESKKEDQTKNL